VQLYQWDPALETGNANVDDQHRRLFVLANNLSEAIASCTSAGKDACEDDEDALANAIFGLTDYCVEHFADEEGLMAAADYPQLSTHRSLHEQLSGETLKRAADYFNDAGVVPESLAPFFADWLTNHIRREDLHFAAYLRAKDAAL
jgi:hemerythrin